MNNRDLFKDLFRLAVRLLGLFFLYVGLKDLDVPALMDVTIIKGDNWDDLISTLLPVGFNLAIGWWLLGNNFLVRRAYPEVARVLGLSPSSSGPVTPSAQPPPPPQTTELEAAEQKLAALMGKPNEHRPGQ